MAAEFVASAAANTVGNLATEYASPYVSYFFHFGKIVDDFKLRRHELELKRDRVKNDVDKAIRQTEVIEKDVQDWLKRAEKELGEGQTLEDEIERHKCFNWCPNWGWRYCLSKRVAKKTLCVSKLLDTSDFPRVGLRPPLQGIEFLLPQDFMASESSNVAFNGIMKALNSDGVNMIGLYGMAGVGKTTLVQAVGKLAGQQKLFDTVVMVTMSQTPNIDIIQNKIAGILGLTFQTEEGDGKAEELYQRLKGEKKILIIVDDIWKEFKLQTIGIPFGEHECCKILLTTRIQQVCFQMNCQEKFQLSILNEGKAWALFKDKAGLKDGSSRLIDVAKEVAGECKGLPLAIVTMAKALNGESLDEWIAANQRLKDSRHLDNEHICGEIYKCLELSYDYLKGENIRSCLLLCSLFPEDFDIPIELLVMLGIGHGLFCELSSIEDLRREIRVALTKLQKSGLLLETGDKSTVRMHDVVRDFAHWLISKGKNKFMVKDGLTEWPKIESFGCYEAISLWNCDISNFPEKLEFSKLKTLILDGNDSLRVPSTFFEGMKALTVLLLKDVIFSLEALQYLTNVRILWFASSQLENISSAWRYMENLEILALYDTNIQELPEELEGCGLKLLYFSCSEEQQCKFPPKLLSRFSSLQELYVTSGNNVNISEVNSLSRLTALSLKVSTEQCCQKNYVFPKLQRYNIAVNKDPDMASGAFLTVRTLKINEFSSSSLSVFENVFCNMEKLTLKNIVMEHKNLVPNVYQRGLNELTSLKLAICGDLEYLIDTKQKQGPTTAFSSLVALKVKEMTCFKGLCHGQPPMRFLQKLETLTIDDCPKLQWVFQMDEMTNITTIKAELEENQAITLSNLSCLELKSLPELRCIWKGSTHLVNLQSLTTMTIWSCGKLAYLFSPSLAQTLLLLESLEIHNCSSLEHLITEAENEDEIVSNMQHHSPLCWKKLKTLKIINCERLKYVFPMTLAQGLPCLESLDVIDSPQLIQLFNAKEQDGQDHIELQRLRFLRLINLINLSRFCAENIALSLSVKELKVWNCPLLTCFENHKGVTLQAELKGVHAYKEWLCNAKNLSLIQVMYHKNLIPNVDPEGLNELAFLKLEDGKELECLIDTTHQGHVSTTAFVNLVELVIKNMTGLKMLCNGRFPKGFLQSLEKLEIRNCMEMVSLSPSPTPQNLKKVMVSNCGQLQEVFEIDDSTLHDPKEKQAVLLSTLTHLELEALPELKCIWKGPSQYISLQSLKVAKISHCNRLNYLFSPALAQSLMLLEELEISQCSGLELIIKELESGDEIDLDGPLSLPKLKTLKLRDCPRLKYVFQIPLPALQSLEVWNCPQLKNYTIQKEVQLKKLSLSNLGNDNGLLEKMFQDQAAGHFLSEKIELNDIHQWEGPIRVSSLQYLTVLQVSNCNRLKSLFSSMLARNLPQLTELSVEYCEELEEIIEMDQTSASSSQGHLQPISFPSLDTIYIKECNNLKRLFPVSVTRSLSQVRYIRINGASRLEHVFGNEDELDIEDNQKEIITLVLERLSLENLPSLRSVVPMGYHFQFPRLYRFEVRGSSNLTTSFSVDSEDVVHAITKAPLQVENNTADGFTTREEIVDNQPSTCNDIHWDRWDRKNEIPPYINVEETEDNVTQ